MMFAKINEIFKSDQGEGLWQGRSQVFVRFFGCNLKCQFCDTKQNDYKLMPIKEVIKTIDGFKDFHSISLTGGEPLLQVDFIQELIQHLKRKGQTIYLETNRTLYQDLAKVVDYLDMISMDFKFPSSTGQPSFWQEHENFIKIAENNNLFVKAVIGKNTTIEDLDMAIEIIKKNRPDLCLILQPENPHEHILADKLITFKKRCTDQAVSVKIVSQLHKKLGIK
ncbi:MAG: 7-carboxy-7-deazaguanine synthase QueE [Candidatus Omnitrophica bacterium]|nr:7-carboxy-7-deazaguanine synthase QueE [Candidatus Omnitrophota bacterium]